MLLCSTRDRCTGRVYFCAVSDDRNYVAEDNLARVIDVFVDERNAEVAR
jgi:hypothetical protein